MMGEVKPHFITNNEEYIENSKEAIKEMAISLESLSIQFTYEFAEKTHDRSIVLDNGWRIVLGRGRNIYQKTNG